MDPAVITGGLALAAGGGLLGVVAWHDRRPVELQSLELRFGTDVTTSAVEAVLAGIAGLPARSSVVLDVVGERDGIRYRLHAPPATVDTIRGQLRGVLPAARLDASDRDQPASYTHGVGLPWRGRHPLLHTGMAPETSAALLGALASPLGTDEAVLLRWVLRPGRGPHLPRDDGQARQRQRAAFELLWPSAAPVPREHLRGLRTKYAGAVLHGRPYVFVRAEHPQRSAQLAGRVTAVLRSRTGVRGQLRVQRLSGRAVTRALQRPTSGHGGDPYSPTELAPLLGWPIDAPPIPGLALGTAPLLMPSSKIPTTGTGRVFATATWPGMTDRQLVQPVEGALSHSLLLGPTGVGKSALITNLVAQGVAQGRGALLLDMKGDTASDVLARIPKERHSDVIVLEPASGLPVPGLRVFGEGDPELVADMLLGTLRGLFKDSWGVRSDQYLRQGLVTLAHDPSATLVDLIYLFNDAGYRARLVGRLDDPLLQAAWAAYEAMKPAEQAQHLASPLRKIHEVVGRKVVRATLAQAEPRFDMREVLATGKVVVVSLSPGRLGAPAVQLLGALVVYQLYSAVLARQAMPESRRRPFGFYVDEPKVLGAGVPIPLDAMFELFRGMGCAITLGGQSITQLPRDVQRAALTNAATLVAFRQSRQDADLLARELPGVSAEGLQHLDRFEVALRLGLGHGDVAPTTTGRTLAPSQPISDPDQLRRLSAARYGVDPEEVDRALRERHNLDVAPVVANNSPDAADSEMPVGWQRRAS